MEKLLLVAEQKHYMQGWEAFGGDSSTHLLRKEINYMSNKFGEVRLLQTLGWFCLYVIRKHCESP